MCCRSRPMLFFFFFFTDTATTEIYTLSLHDALPISMGRAVLARDAAGLATAVPALTVRRTAHVIPSVPDRKSTRLNSSHTVISYAVFCLKKKKTKKRTNKNRHQRNLKLASTTASLAR